MKATVIIFIVLCSVATTLKSCDEIPKNGHSINSLEQCLLVVLFSFLVLCQVKTVEHLSNLC